MPATENQSNTTPDPTINQEGGSLPNASAVPQNTATVAQSTGNTAAAINADTAASNTQPSPNVSATDATLAAANRDGQTSLANATANQTSTAVAIPTEGTPAHETFRQELDEFLQSAERDAKEVIAWLKKHI